MTGRSHALGSVDDLRRAFDESFAEPAVRERDDDVHVLLIRCGGTRFALRLEDVAMIVPDSPVTNLPARDPAVLGLALIRNALVIVYDLAALVGATASGSPRFVALAAASRKAAFAFDALEAYRRLPAAQVSDVVHLDSGAPVPVLSIASLASGIESRADARAKERE